MSDRIGKPIVIDASALVALLVDAGSAGQWVTDSTEGSVLAAPELALFEAADVTAVITRHSVENLGLVEGDTVTVIIKSTEVMVAKG